MLSYEAFQNLSKAQLYELYVATYKKMEEKDDIVKKHVLTVSDYLTRSNPSQPTSHQTSASNNQVRSFQAFDIREKTTNLVIGSSLVKNLMNDRSIPEDVSVHAYKGSTTQEKLALMEQYPDLKMKTVLLQDGTNSILRNKNKDISELADDTCVLIQAIKEKCSPDVLVFMEVPPIKKSTNNDSTNEKIKLFNRKMREKLKSFEFDIKILAMHDMLLNLPSYNELYYDAIHFNYQRGVPFLKNAILSYVLLTSNNFISNSNRPMNYRNKWNDNRSFSNQSYNYMRGYY